VKLATAKDRDRWLDFVRGQPLPLEVSSEPWKPRRSDPQNRYLWGVVYPAFTARLEGWSAEDVHEYLLGEHFGWETIEGMGRKRMKPLRRSARLNKADFAAYVDSCIRIAATHGIFVPGPEDA
jgi:hypothetical protein